ncbi:MAG: PDZ domain-containing protein [Phycisphaerales bacterium]|nr:MAG: PDZ domain-containing protein [Phycisphaerales bacterium]
MPRRLKPTRCSPGPALLVALLAALIACLTTAALAQPGREAPDEPMAPAFRAFAEGEYAEAEALLRPLLNQYPDSFILRYNLACALSMQGRPDEAVEYLFEAARLGFTDAPTMRRDPHLAAARETDAFRALDERWDDLLRAHADATFESLQRQFGPRYIYHRDDEQRLLFAVGFDQTLFDQARAEIDRTHDWFVREVEPSVDRAQPEDAWVSIVLPTRADFKTWAQQRFGPGGAGSFFQIGGEYNHDRKQLVAADLGPTLRHEYAHVLHWRHNARLAQQHHIWIQEGLCSLPEDLDPDPAIGLHQPVPNWRTNSVKRLAAGLSLPPLRDYLRIPRDRFTSGRPLANYAIARSLMLFLHDRGQLRDFYRLYTESLSDNPTDDPAGYQAMLDATGLAPHEFDRAFRLWLRDLPEVAERIPVGGPSLGVEVDAGTGLGPTVTTITRPRAERRNFPLRPGDAITAINGRTTRDLSELVRVLSDHQPGETVDVRVRTRGNQETTHRIQLVERQPD